MIREFIKLTRMISSAKDNVPVKKSAWCGNPDNSFLYDEGDTVYCQRCHRRTRKDTGTADAIICPRCRKLRDRKAYLCSECNY